MTLAERLCAALSQTGGATPIEGDDYDRAAGDYRPAAVLVAVTDRSEPGVLLTLRQTNLRRHAGQIAFPGGRVDPEDADAEAAALREAEEEIGLDPALVEVVGATDIYRVGTGFSVTPVIGVVPPDLPLMPHEAEVAAIFEVPLMFLLQGSNHLQRSTEWEGRTRSFHEILWEDRRIWGATAGMIVNLSRRLRPLLA
ncbi:CoA pyrophosphatase [uncultured Sphingomonas sp.]|uniref:CoA pyrophosphatase n=1 Tax=uncultured Sphingomonas sp. TaxID=158754 RepID=UPI0025D81303|nr:CoA pyrophosphatase [uncultured Sphingomonas sp.]